MPAVRWSTTMIAVAATVLGALAGAARAATVPPDLRAAAVTGTWGTAQEVPGTANLNRGGDATVNSVSCASAGNCAAGGYYSDGSGNQQAFVASQVYGSWHTAVEVPGTAALNRGGDAQVNSVSCASAGNCSAGGYYENSTGAYQALVVNEVHGVWQPAITTPGTATLNKGGDAKVLSVSCASAGNCSAGGYYVDASSHWQAFVANEVHGTWQPAVEVPGTAALNQAWVARVSTVSCASAGNCSGGGFYSDSRGYTQAFVVNEVNGTWQPAIEVPGTAALNRYGTAQVLSVSCASAGNCSAGGSIADSYPFVVNEVNGTWQPAILVSGTAFVHLWTAQVTSVSCASAGNCGAGGTYTDTSGYSHAFVVNNLGGTWQPAIELPGAQVQSMSCASAGNCAAVGGASDYTPTQAFVVSEVNGKWLTLMHVPGASGVSAVNSVSCSGVSECSAGGYYTDISARNQAFVLSDS